MLKERTVLVTGSSGGIGSVLCEHLIVGGYHVIGLDRVSNSDSPTSKFDFIKCDLADIGNTEAVSTLQSKLAQLDAFHALSGLVNNAAVQITGPVCDMALEDFRKTLDVNVTAAFELSRLCYDRLAANKGSVVNISSIHARLSKKNFVAYATSKAALSALTRYLAVEWGGIIRVNAIEPAAVDTKMLTLGFEGDASEIVTQLEYFHPSGTIATPEEISHSVLDLLAHESFFLTGCIMAVTGGIDSLLHDIEV